MNLIRRGINYGALPGQPESGVGGGESESMARKFGRVDVGFLLNRLREENRVQELGKQRRWRKKKGRRWRKEGEKFREKSMECGCLGKPLLQ